MKRRAAASPFEASQYGNAFAMVPCPCHLGLIRRGACNDRQTLPAIEVSVKQGSPEGLKIFGARRIDAPMRTGQSQTHDAGSSDIEPLIDLLILGECPCG